MDITKINKIVNLLLVYMLATILMVGLLGTDITSDMVGFVIIYGVPLLIVTVIFIGSAAIKLFNHTENNDFNKKQTLAVCIKLTIAFTPMLLLNNTGAHILSLMRQS